MGAETGAKESAAIREFRDQQDASQVAEILQEARQATFWPEQDLRALGRMAGVLAYVSESEGRVTGVVIGRSVLDEAEILNLAVRRASRRRGQGKSLMERLLDQFSQRGVRRVFLEVRESNADAIAFYQYLGFRAAGARKDYYEAPKESALVMEKRLGKSTE